MGECDPLSRVYPPDPTSWQGRTYLLVEAIAYLVHDGRVTTEFDNIVGAIAELHPDVAPIDREAFRQVLERGRREGRFGIRDMSHERVVAHFVAEPRYVILPDMDQRHPTQNGTFKAFHMYLMCHGLGTIQGAPQSKTHREQKREQTRAREKEWRHRVVTTAAPRPPDETVDIPVFGHVVLHDACTRANVARLRRDDAQRWQRHVRQVTEWQHGFSLPAITKTGLTIRNDTLAAARCGHTTAVTNRRKELDWSRRRTQVLQGRGLHAKT